MIEQKPIINDFDNGLSLNENGTDDSITLYGEAANILYGSDAQFIL